MHPTAMLLYSPYALFSTAVLYSTCSTDVGPGLTGRTAGITILYVWSIRSVPTSYLQRVYFEGGTTYIHAQLFARRYSRIIAGTVSSAVLFSPLPPSRVQPGYWGFVLQRKTLRCDNIGLLRGFDGCTQSRHKASFDEHRPRSLHRCTGRGFQTETNPG